MSAYAPPTGKINTDPLGTGRVDLLRCVDCRKGLDTSLTNGIICPYCGGRTWTTRVGTLSLWEVLKLLKGTGVLFLTEGSWWQRRIIRWTSKNRES